MTGSFARAGARMVKAARMATDARSVASGAALGTVVEGDTPTLTVLLDTGQTVPQCMGPPLGIGSRVLCFWVNEGHDLAVVNFGSAPPFEFDWGWTVPAGDAPSGRFLDTETGESWLTSGFFDPAPWYWAPSGLTRLTSDTPATDGPPIGIGTVIPGTVGYAVITSFFLGWTLYTRLTQVFVLLGDAVIAAGNVNGTAYLGFVDDLAFPDGNPTYTVLADDSNTDLGTHTISVERTPDGSDDVYTATYGAASVSITLPRLTNGVAGVVIPWSSQGSDTLSTRIQSLTAGGIFA